MKRLDRYVASTFLLSYVAALVVLISLFTISEVIGQVDDVAKTVQIYEEMNVSVDVWNLAARYFLLKAPLIFLHVGPFVVLFAAIFTIATFQRAGELIPMITAGRSLRRILLPMGVLSALAAFGMWALREGALDVIATEKENLEKIVMEREPGGFEVHNLWFRDSEQIFVGIELFEPEEKHARRLTLHRVLGPEKTLTIHAESVRYDEAAGRWMAHPVAADDGKLQPPFQVYGDEESPISTVPVREAAAEPVPLPWPLRFSPSDVRLLYRYRSQPLELTSAQLDRIALFYPSDSSVQTLKLYFLTYPLATIVLLLVGLPFCLRFEKYNVFEGLGLGLLVCFLYFATDFVLRDLGTRQILNPEFACLSPVILFGSLGLAWFTTMRT